MRHKKSILRRLKNSDRQRLIRARVVFPHNDDLESRKQIEKMWEKYINSDKDKK